MGQRQSSHKNAQFCTVSTQRSEPSFFTISHPIVPSHLAVLGLLPDIKKMRNFSQHFHLPPLQSCTHS